MKRPWVLCYNKSYVDVKTKCRCWQLSLWSREFHQWMQRVQLVVMILRSRLISSLVTLQIALNYELRLELRTNLKTPLYCTSAAVAPICWVWRMLDFLIFFLLHAVLFLYSSSEKELSTISSTYVSTKKKSFLEENHEKGEQKILIKYFFSI